MILEGVLCALNDENLSVKFSELLIVVWDVKYLDSGKSFSTPFLLLSLKNF
jgi:hypothetical protein